jgi:hypothetical protein
MYIVPILGGFVLKYKRDQRDQKSIQRRRNQDAKSFVEVERILFGKI